MCCPSHQRRRYPRHASVRGQVLLEAAIALPALILLVLLTLQLSLLYQARLLTAQAAYAAARAGIVHGADPEAMQTAATLALLPTLGRTDDTSQWALSAVRAIGTGDLQSAPEALRRAALGLPILQVSVLSPRPADLTPELTRHTGGFELDFDDPRPAAARANLLEIEVTYYFQLRIPLAGRLLQSLFFATRGTSDTRSDGAHRLLDAWTGPELLTPRLPLSGAPAESTAAAQLLDSDEPFAHALLAARAAPAPLGGYFVPIRATRTLRMQSNLARTTLTPPEPRR